MSDQAALPEEEPAPKAPGDANTTHLAGEFFVAAELSKRGYSVSVTLGNAKAVDLFAEKDGRTVNIQVKAIRSRKSNGWPMVKSKVRRSGDLVYAFVCLNEIGEPPSYFVLTGAEAYAKTKQYETRGIINVGSLRSPEFVDRWDKLDGPAQPL
ncbi:group I intron-associated PD-(D/E)XK endonuclease [Rhodospirillaceae bacterium SYSU D60014]|uniref:group I intron-associated PD-(D/E)XK endonuclease n=1 Tax=Virgifigura deserti TaxID=2268457 RepID=UPI0013C4A40A